MANTRTNLVIAAIVGGKDNAVMYPFALSSAEIVKLAKAAHPDLNVAGICGFRITGTDRKTTELAMVAAKPHKGEIKEWNRIYFNRDDYHASAPNDEYRGGLGYCIYGIHETEGWWRTSYVMAYDAETGEIETRNSKYKLIGDDVNEVERRKNEEEERRKRMNERRRQNTDYGDPWPSVKEKPVTPFGDDNGSTT